MSNQSPSTASAGRCVPRTITSCWPVSRLGSAQQSVPEVGTVRSFTNRARTRNSPLIPQTRLIFAESAYKCICDLNGGDWFHAPHIPLAVGPAKPHDCSGCARSLSRASHVMTVPGFEVSDTWPLEYVDGARLGSTERRHAHQQTALAHCANLGIRDGFAGGGADV